MKELLNGWQCGSVAAGMRMKRMELFDTFIRNLPRPVRILDVGGQESYYLAVQYTDPKCVRVTLLNPAPVETHLPGFDSVVGDGRDMHAIADGQYDICFSNSTIEHVGNLREQHRFAREVRRVAKRYFVQTPNRWFPIEPHFLFPFFQFIPLAARATLHHCFRLGWWNRARTRLDALEEVESIRLLTETECRFLFPDGTIWKERFLGMTKSFVIYGMGKARTE